MKRLLASLLLLCAGVASAATLVSPGLINPAGSTAGQVLTSTGATTAPGFASVTFGILPQLAANTVLGNKTASSAVPAAITMPSCSASGNALTWTSGTGFTCATGNALTASTLAQFAATTSAQLAGVISDETGSGSLVFGTSPTIATPTINQPTINGITNATSAPAGAVGEYPTFTNLTGVSLTSATVVNLSSASLTAGDYDVSCTGIFTPAGSTVPLAALVAVSTVSAGMPSPSAGQQTQIVAAFATGSTISLPTPVVRINVSTTTTVYCVGQLNFTTSTATGAGIMRARRVH